MELVTPLAIVNGCSSGHAGAPKRTLVVRDARWVVTTRSRIDTWVSLHVYVEGRTEIGRVTELLAFDSVVGLECRES